MILRSFAIWHCSCPGGRAAWITKLRRSEAERFDLDQSNAGED
jgi:hypothetical protein